MSDKEAPALTCCTDCSATEHKVSDTDCSRVREVGGK